ncbi:MAG: DUF1638 domain-containing protein [Spirochaetaceae bacterium]|jgi:hypothetical protein|nr:DUF1638 domain-containing protein [Spirochaetaceae bacterium]
MRIDILSCGIFRPELDIAIAEIRDNFKGHNIEITYLPPSLHVYPLKMEEELTKNLDKMKDSKVLVLYGSMCHADLPEIAEKYNALVPKEKNCIEIMLRPEIKNEMDKTGNINYLTAGWLKTWKEISADGAMIGDKIIYLDCGANLISDEEILYFFDCANLPIETVPITLDNFKEVIIKLCKEIIEPKE